MLASSLFLGTSGIYHILDITVEFENDSPLFHSFSNNLIGKMGNGLLKNHIFQILTFGYLHTFVHEMGHALAYKILSGASSHIQISTFALSGVTTPNPGKMLSPIQKSIFSLGGPLADVVFSVSQIFAAFALSAYITVPVAIAITIGASIWIFGEAFYAADSLLKNDNGDFAYIARNGVLHLLGATAVMAGVIALGILATKRVM
jgi:hypothetical protein